MGVFRKKEREPQSWVDDVEEFSNFAVGLKMATDEMIEAAIDGNDELCSMLWDKMTTEQRQYGYWFMLGMLAQFYNDRDIYE